MADKKWVESAQESLEGLVGVGSREAIERLLPIAKQKRREGVPARVIYSIIAEEAKSSVNYVQRIYGLSLRGEDEGEASESESKTSGRRRAG